MPARPYLLSLGSSTTTTASSASIAATTAADVNSTVPKITGASRFSSASTAIRADARPAEEPLRHHRAPDERPELQRRHGGDGHERVAQGVDDEHARARRALGARGAHEVLREDPAQLVAEEAGVEGAAEDAERERGEDEGAEVLGAACAP